MLMRGRNDDAAAADALVYPRRRPHRVARETRGAWSTAGPSATRVEVHESRPLVRAGLEAIVVGAPSLELVTGHGRGDPSEPGANAVQVLVVGGPDVEPGRLAGDPPAIVVADAFSDAQILDLLGAGAAGVLLHSSAPDLLEVAVGSACDGRCFVDPGLARRLVAMAARGRRTSGPFELTIQEQRVLALVARDLTNRRIGDELGLSLHTVKAHVRGAMRKLGAADRHHAVELARGRDLPPWHEDRHR